MNRRDFARLGCATVIGAATGKLRPAFAQSVALGHVPVAQPQHTMTGMPEPKAAGARRISHCKSHRRWSSWPRRLSSARSVTATKSPVLSCPDALRASTSPSTFLNDTDVPEYVHWHGLLVPSEVDGAEEEGTPPVPPHGRRRYQFVAKPAGSRWYHSHTAAMMDLHRGSYTGQFGFFMIDPANDPGRYDQEVFLALCEWEPFLSAMDQDEMEADPNDPMPEKPATPDQRPNGLEVSGPLYSINDKMLGAGEPLRVQSGQRILMHLLNASASQIHRIGLFGHHFQVIALDGNPVPTPQTVDVIEIAPGERVDHNRGDEICRARYRILGELRDAAQQSGMEHRGGVCQSGTAAPTMDFTSEGALGLHDLWQCPLRIPRR